MNHLRVYIGLIAGVLFLISCGTTQSSFTIMQLKSIPSLSARLEAFYWDDALKQEQKARGVMRWVKEERIQLSFRIPLVQSEALRIEFTPTSIVIINRLDKEYVYLSFLTLRKHFPYLLTFDQLEEELCQSISLNGKDKILGSRLGFPAFEHYDLYIYHVDLRVVELYQTKIPKSYTEISENDFIHQMKGL